jgi:hypothetical protein
MENGDLTENMVQERGKNNWPLLCSDGISFRGAFKFRIRSNNRADYLIHIIQHHIHSLVFVVVVVFDEEMVHCRTEVHGSNQVSISPPFYSSLFRTKVLHKAFLYLHFRFHLFWAQEYLRNCAHKILVKLTNKRKQSATIVF